MSDSLSYVHPDAREALARAFKHANLTPVIVQTFGHAVASAGTHGEAGKYRDGNNSWHVYSACIDISVNQRAKRLSDGASIEMTLARCKWLLYCLSEEGIAAWLRTTAQGFAPHIHGVFAMVKMPELPARQVVDFINNRTGLRSHKTETFYTPDDDNDVLIASLFKKANPDFVHLLPAKFR